LLACTMAYLAKRKNKEIQINSATYLATLLDFSEPGELSLFVSSEQHSIISQQIELLGVMDGRALASVFSLLRANDLIWNYYIKNYLRGEKPKPFDLLYWNSDPTNLPARMYNFYIENFYLKNLLIKDNKLILDQVKLNLKIIKQPAFFVATEQDHITPWRSVYNGLNFYGNDTTFVLGGAGHVAGIVNPPEKKKYGYKILPKDLNLSVDTWISYTTQSMDSWWVYWKEWLMALSGKQIHVKINKIYLEKNKIEDAPGHYVLKRL